MATFNDTQGRQWSIAMTIGSAKRVKEQKGIDLLSPEQGDQPVMTKLATDEFLLAEVIACLLEDQFEKHNVTAEQVPDLFDGATLLSAQKAFYSALSDFFQSRGRTERAAAILRQAEIIRQATERATKAIEALDIETLLSGKPSLSLPASSE